MNPFEKFRDECSKIAGENAGLLEIPPNNIADLALPCFSISKKPAEKAAELAACYRKKIKKASIIKDISTAGPYVNFHINNERLCALVMKTVIKNENYGAGSQKKTKIILEHTSMNPSGPVHVGRLRNSIIGDCLKRILKFSGYEVDTHYYVNDIGKQVAMILWAKDNTSIKNELPEQYPNYKNKPDFQTMFWYVSAYEMLEKQKPQKMEEVDNMIIEAEKGNRKILEKLKEISKSCLDGQLEVLKRLDIIFDRFDFESKYIENGSAMEAFKNLKPAAKKKEGAFGLDLSKHGMRDFAVILRGNGTSVYLLRDIAYHMEKMSRCDRAVVVLGEDHKVEFQELKHILSEFFGMKKPLDVVHYSFVNFKGVKLSTRQGQTAPLDMLLDEGESRAKEEIGKKGIDGKDKIAKSVAKAAVRYNLIKSDMKKAMTFVWNDALSFEGDTGPYLQYTYARARSILKKSRKKPKPSKNLRGLEIDIIKEIAKFPEFVERAGSELKPQHIATYVYRLASMFNTFYHNTKIIGSKDEEALLALTKSVTITLKNAMELIGIDAIEQM
jgi:arginyl-tRNA synthetase